MSTKNSIVTGQINASVTVDRAPMAIGKLLSFTGRGDATFATGANFTATELGEYAAQEANDSQSAALRAVAALRIARGLPKVKVPKAGKPDETYERDAYDIACERCASLCVTASAWQNVKGLVLAVDIALANQLEPYKVKNSLGYLNKLGLIDEKTLKIKASAKDDIGVKSIMDDSVKSNAVVKKLNDAKLAHNAEAKAAKKEVPFPSLEKKTAPATPVVTAVSTDATPESLARMIASVVGLHDKLAGIDAKNIPLIRAACKAELEKLAKLNGYKLVSL